MTSSLKIAIVTAVTVTIALVCFAWSVLSAGAGHGSYLPFAVSFPYAFLSVAALGGEIGLIALSLMFAQFLVYGIVLGRAWLVGRLPNRAAAVVISHAVVATICTLIFYGT